MRRSMETALFLFVTTMLAATSHARYQFNPISLPLPLSAGTNDQCGQDLDCLSWRLAVETNNLRDWKTVPESCVKFVDYYMLGGQYSEDCNTVAGAAIKYAKSLTLPSDGKNVWVFDIDETTLSNLPYYSRDDVQFGAKPYNRTKFQEWLKEGKLPAVPGGLRVYQTLTSLGIKIVFISGVSDEFTEVLKQNLRDVGYFTIFKLILKSEDERGPPSLEYKSKKRAELVNEGYRIVGSMGDQWSDLLGNYTGDQTFKMPNPMYYVG